VHQRAARCPEAEGPERITLVSYLSDYKHSPLTPRSFSGSWLQDRKDLNMFRRVLRPCVSILYNHAMQRPLLRVSVLTLPQVLSVPPSAPATSQIKTASVPLIVARHLSSHSADPSSPWSTVKLPPLPKIQSERIRRRVFTHRSLTSGHGLSSQPPEGHPNTDNEELAHIGDQVVGFALTDLIQHIYPNLRAVPATKLRCHVNRNIVIAELCVLYGLHKRLKIDLPEDRASSVRASRNAQVDVFKAYVGGVYREQGFEAVSKWLFSVFRSFVEDTYQTQVAS